MSITQELYLFFGLNAFFFLSESYINEQMRKIILLALVFLAIIVVGFRSPNETPDTFMYMSYFSEFPEIGDALYGDTSYYELWHIETGYLFVGAIIKAFTEYTEIFFLIIGAIALGCYYMIFLKRTSYPLTAFFIYVSTFFIMRECVQIRQGIACALVLLSTHYIINKQYYKYIACLIVGCCFHMIAITGFALIIVNNIDWTAKKIYIVCFICLIISQISWIYQIAESLGDMGLMYYRVGRYLGTKVATQNVTIIKFLVNVGILLFCGRILVNSQKNKYENLLIGMFALGALSQGVFFEFREVADRVSSMYYTAMFLMIPAVMTKIKKQIILRILLLIMMGWYFARMVNWLTDPMQSLV